MVRVGVKPHEKAERRAITKHMKKKLTSRTKNWGRQFSPVWLPHGQQKVHEKRYKGGCADESPSGDLSRISSRNLFKHCSLAYGSSSCNTAA